MPPPPSSKMDEKPPIYFVPNEKGSAMLSARQAHIERKNAEKRGEGSTTQFSTGAARPQRSGNEGRDSRPGLSHNDGPLDDWRHRAIQSGLKARDRRYSDQRRAESGSGSLVGAFPSSSVSAHEVDNTNSTNNTDLEITIHDTSSVGASPPVSTPTHAIDDTDRQIAIQSAPNPPEATVMEDPFLAHVGGGIKEGAPRTRRSRRWLALSGCSCVVILVSVVVMAAILSLRAKTSPTAMEIKGTGLESTLSPTEAVIFRLPDYTLESINEDEASPQAKAWIWVQNHSEYLNTTMPIWRKNQLMGLATLMFASSKSEWLNSSIHECDWDIYDPVYTAKCNSDGKIQRLHLSGRGLKGTLPPELSLLGGLSHLGLPQNIVSGLIPSQLGMLTKLELLDLDDNLLSWIIPTELGHLTKLTSLGFSDNNFYTPLPSEIGLLTGMMELRFFHSQITGTLPTELMQLTSLKQLMIWTNDLTGTIPVEIGRMSSLERYHASGNYFSGSIPTEIGSLTALTWLALSLQPLTGQIPSEIGNLKALTWMSLNDLQLSGTLPTELGECTSASKIGFLNNMLVGTVPSELGVLTNLLLLRLSGNQLTGSIPSEMAGLSSLEVLELNDNGFKNTTIDEAFCELPHIEHIFVDCESVSCTCPSCSCSWFQWGTRP